ncbi:MAG: S8 family peptidase [Candidatus Geothermincolia bacterium]
MKRNFSMVVVVALVAALLSAGGAAAEAKSPGPRAVAGAPGKSVKGAPVRPGAKYVPGQVLVKFKGGAGAGELGAVLNRAGASARKQLTASGLEQVDTGSLSVESAIASLRASPLVEYAEPNYIRSISLDPDDPYYANPPNYQWNMKNAPAVGGIDMPQAWDAVPSRGSTSVVVAILDTGVAYRTGGGFSKAPDLTNNFKQGYDFINNDAYADDDHGHGTHVCGTVAQATNNGQYCAGVADGTTVMPVKVLDRTGYGDDAVLIQGIEFAADQGAEVINMSLGGPDPSVAIEGALEYAVGKNVVICAAAGNTSLAAVEYPAAYDECVAVGATNRVKARASYSNYGAALDVVAPGGDGTGPIYQVTFKNERQPSSGFIAKGMTGTSMATPHVSGVAALVKAVHPTWAASDVRGAISSSCFDLGAPGWDAQFGWGLIDAYAAVQAPKPSATAPLPTAVSPAYANQNTTPQLVVTGSGFSSRMKVTLERESETGLSGTSVAVTGTTKITCDMAIGGVQPGLWNLVAENSALRSGQIAGGFSVDNADNKTWYLAEGSTAYGFEEYILVQNPNTTTANVTLALMATDGPLPDFGTTVPANSRVTIRVNDIAPDKDLSAKLTSDQNIICERAMYWAGRIEGTDSIGVQSPSFSWYLAEGTTNYGFETFLLIQNPTNRPANVQVVYMTPSGPVAGVPFVIEANSRYTINVAQEPGLAATDVSFEVNADQRVIAERSMYWDGRRGGHVSTGTNLPAQNWYLAEGSTDWGYDEYVLIENPGEQAANVTLTYMTPTGAVPQLPMSVSAGTRATVHVNAALPQKDVSVKVTSDQGVVAERAMYWNNGSGKAGHDQLGVTQPRQQCFLAEGSTDWGFDEWVLIQNPNGTPANVGINYMTSTGLRPKNAFVLGAYSRVSVHVNADVPGVDTSTQVYSNLPVIAERSMYWHDKSAGHCSTGLMK